MLYVGIILFLIGAWQLSMSGQLSPIIGGVSLILGVIFVFVGDWHTGLFFCFLFVTWYLLMQIFRFSTYHKFFLKAIPFLIIYSICVGLLIVKFDFLEYFWLHISLSCLFLLSSLRQQFQLRKAFDMLSKGNEMQLPDALLLDKHNISLDKALRFKELAEKSTSSELEESFKNTIKFHVLSSIAFICILVMSVFYFSNT